MMELQVMHGAKTITSSQNLVNLLPSKRTDTPHREAAPATQQPLPPPRCLSYGLRLLFSTFPACGFGQTQPKHSSRQCLLKSFTASGTLTEKRVNDKTSWEIFQASLELEAVRGP